jgi:hypothetical protein
MKTSVRNNRREEEGTILAYFILLLIAIAAITSVAAYVTHTTAMSRRRASMADAYEYITAGAVMACADLNVAFTNGGSTVIANLQTLPSRYTVNSSLSTNNQKVLQRTISDPFTNQTVNAQIWIPDTPVPTTAKIVTTAAVGDISQTITLNVKMASTFPAAIISVNDGSTDTSVSKQSAQRDGNVVINGSGAGPIIVDGNSGLAVYANGRVNYDTNYLNPPSSAYSMTNQGTINQLPDYTSQGTTNSLFDIGRFVAVAEGTPNGPSPSRNNHFTNMISFINACTNFPGTGSNAMMQGVVVVDVWDTDKNMGDLTPKSLPNGINVEGSLLFNFLGSGWNPTTSKIVVTAAVNVNPADLSGLVTTDPGTYATGFPPVYADPTKDPARINIVPYGYQNFTTNDDLPALVYSIGVVDLHGPLDISGALYTPSYMEIENKQPDQIQYIKGCVIMGAGIYFENTQRGSTSIISYGANTVDSLATLPGMGKTLRVAYWQ